MQRGLKLLLVLVAVAGGALVPQTDNQVVEQHEYSKGYPYPHPAIVYPMPNVFPFDSSCPNHCTGHGECVKSQCICDDGYRGEDCGTSSCPENCHGHGFCNEGFCVCRKGWLGELCNISTCPNECSGHGQCFEGDCFCERNWIGIDCATPKYGVPGLAKPRDQGYPENVRMNSTCMAVRIPKELKEGGPKVNHVNVTVVTNGACAKLKGEPYLSRWTDGSLKPTVSYNLPAGDHVVCDVLEGCSDVIVGVYYGDSKSPVSFANGVGVVASPSPSPVPRQVKVDMCGPEKCSGRGVCMNYTVVMPVYSCVCESPWIPPCCCTKDRNDTRPPAVDPLQFEPAAIPFNNVPCSQDDACSACSEVFVDGDWKGLNTLTDTLSAPVPNTRAKQGGQCVWDAARSQCAALEASGSPSHSMTCRSPGIPDTR